MSKDLFTQMREQEIITNNFLPTKKEIQLAGKEFASHLINSGDYNLKEKYAEVLRLKEAVNIIEAELKDNFPQENFEEFGIKATFRNGGSIPQYEKDIVYSEIKNKLAGRKTLLDAALKTDEMFFDSEGVEVPKVSKKDRKSSLSITF